MKNKLDLKKIFKERKIRITDCQIATEELNDFITLDLIKRGNIDASLVALTSTIMNIACWYNKKEFVIDLLQGCTAQIEQDKFVESGKRLN
tara:strand:+ start:288 stop:560 length:273 start_codon:yes stop_codon:yes gene_type:complete